MNFNYLFALFAGYLLWKIFSPSHPRPLPPGPRKLPFFGNIFDMPQEKEWLVFSKWRETFGKISSAKVFGQTFIILNSAEVAIALLDKRSSIYSNRPVFPMAGELMGWKQTMVLRPYDDRFRKQRRMIHQQFGKLSTIQNYHCILESETQQFLKRLFEHPGNLSEHVRKTAGSIILRISYGYKVTEGEDALVTLADEANQIYETAMEQFSSSVAPTTFIVNLIPALAYVPAWFPGCGFQKIAKEWAHTLEKLAEWPFTFVKQEMAAGTAQPSYTSKLLEESSDLEDEYNIKWSAVSLYAGGADTTVASNYAFFKAMVLYPEVQAKAQSEIDSVIGNARLPCLADREELPYINALTLEILRWHTVVPIAGPHQVTEDDEFNGYHIPKGALILPNVWHMTHDPEIYHRPMKFMPERFLLTANSKPEMDPRRVCFGFGRRICPGRLLADSSVFILCATTLATFDISKYAENGVELVPGTDQSPGVVSHPTAFRCTLTPRSERATSLIREGPIGDT